MKKRGIAPRRPVYAVLQTMDTFRRVVSPACFQAHKHDNYSSSDGTMCTWRKARVTKKQGRWQVCQPRHIRVRRGIARNVKSSRHGFEERSVPAAGRIRVGAMCVFACHQASPGSDSTPTRRPASLGSSTVNHPGPTTRSSLCHPCLCHCWSPHAICSWSIWRSIHSAYLPQCPVNNRDIPVTLIATNASLERDQRLPSYPSAIPYTRGVLSVLDTLLEARGVGEKSRLSDRSRTVGELYLVRGPTTSF